MAGSVGARLGASAGAARARSRRTQAREEGAGGLHPPLRHAAGVVAPRLVPQALSLALGQAPRHPQERLELVQSGASRDALPQRRPDLIDRHLRPLGGLWFATPSV